MSANLLNQDQRDALQEVNNIAMGQAGKSLAELLGVFVQLSIPKINIVEAEQINESMTRMVGDGKMIAAVRQAFSGPMRGESLAVFNEQGYQDLADLWGYEGKLEESVERELLLDVANVLIGSFQSGIAQILGVDISFSAPSIMAKGVPVNDLMKLDQLTWKFAVLIEVNFALEERNFTCHLTQLMPESSIEKLRESIDAFMESF